MFCALCRRLLWRDPKPARAFASANEAERAQSAGRRLRPEAVSGRWKSMGRREEIHGMHLEIARRGCFQRVLRAALNMLRDLPTGPYPSRHHSTWPQ
jgi:hypothetical protein